MSMLWLKEIEFHGFRGLSGIIEFCRGLNIIVGPNCSGKTALIEAIAYILALNYLDLREAHGHIALLHAARGSPAHSTANIVVDKGDIRGIVVEDSVEKKVELRVTKSISYESIGVSVKPIVEIRMESFPRNCKLTYRVETRRTRLGFSDECIKGTEFRMSVITPGIYPFDFFDQLVGIAKKEHSVIWNTLSSGISLNGKKYTVDVASDDWGRLSAYVKENGELVNFYVVGRGLQRALITKAALTSSNIVLIDEIESAMHPELLTELARSIIESIKNGRQVIVTTQSLEAARFLVAALAGVDKKYWRTPHKILEVISSMCIDNNKSMMLNEIISLISLSRDGDKVKAVSLSGCRACEEVFLSEDIRLLYTIAK